MKRFLLPTLFMFALAALQVSLCAAPAAAIVGTPIPIATGPAAAAFPVTYGHRVAWVDNRTGANQIWAKDLTSGEETAIASFSTFLRDRLHIWGDRLLWIDGRTLLVHDFVSGSTTRVAEGASPESCDIAGDRILYLDTRDYAHPAIYAYDLSTDRESILATVGVDAGFSSDGKTVVWATRGEIYMRDFKSHANIRLTHDSVPQFSPTVFGSRVAWTQAINGKLSTVVQDLKTGHRARLLGDAKDPMLPALWGDKLVFKSGPVFPSGNYYENIFVTDLATGIEWHVAYHSELYYGFGFYGNFLVWADTRTAYDDIYGCYIPPAALAPPTVPALAVRNRGFASRGYLLPAHAAGPRSLRVQCYRYEGGRWVFKRASTTLNRTVGQATAYKAWVSLPTKGLWRLRARYLGSKYAQAWSAWRKVRVR